MKTIIKLQIIAVFLSATLMAGGQPFTPVIAADSTSWDVAWKELFGNVMGRLYTVVSKDSMYHDLYFEGIGPEPVFAGKIREDATNGKLWYLPPEGGKEEFLIMDLTLNVGDVFDLPFYNATITVQVTDVYYLDQKKHIEFDFPTQWDEPLRFIEGVGRNIAMFNFWFSELTYVACKYNEGELFYMNSNPNFVGCALNTSSIGESFLDGLRVFPNPAMNFLQFEVHPEFSGSKFPARLRQQEGKFEVMELRLFDVFGRQVARKEITTEQTTLDVSGLPGGVYFYRLGMGEVVYSGKIIIHR